VSGAVYAMAQAAQKDGVNLSADSCYRTMANQQTLWVKYGMDPVRVARPGYSNHQMGIAMDIIGAGDGPAPGSGAIWNWLTKNADKFGYKNYPAEAWHWSPTGN
jgi:LAS superfamily LD-carboxypeptidase LdcB